MATLATPASFTGVWITIWSPVERSSIRNWPARYNQDIATNVVLDWDQLLGGRKTGVVFVEAERVGESERSNPRLGTQSLIQLTDLGLAWKSAAGDLDAFVFSQSTGQPAAGAAVRLLDDENQVLRESLADAGGLAHLKCPTNAQWVAAALGQDFHALKIADHEIPLYSFDLPRLWPGEAAPARPVMIFSDREFYRPNETLHLKALARDWTRERPGGSDRIGRHAGMF